MIIHERCKKCRKKFKLGDCIYEGGICIECGGKGMPIAGIVSKDFFKKMGRLRKKKNFNTNKK